MRQWLRSHLTYANVMATIAVFLVLGGGSAVALSGSNTVFTDDIANDTQPASGGNPAGGLVAADLRPNSVGTSEVTNNALTGNDIYEPSLGVNDSCPQLMTKVQEVICIDDNYRDVGGWGKAVNTCVNNGLRLPTATELFIAYRNGRVAQASQTGGVGGVWTDTPWTASGAGHVNRAVALYASNGEMYAEEMPSLHPFYCVGPLSDNY